jgi:hypothetical protein
MNIELLLRFGIIYVEKNIIKENLINEKTKATYYKFHNYTSNIQNINKLMNKLLYKFFDVIMEHKFKKPTCNMMSTYMLDRNYLNLPSCLNLYDIDLDI